MKDKNNISDLLDIANDFEEEVDQCKEMVPHETIDTIHNENHDQDVKDDYDLVRRTLRACVGKSEGILNRTMEIMNDSDSPRVAEVASGVIRSIADLSKTLIDIHKEKKDIDGKSKGENGIVEPNEGDGDTHIYIGTTADLTKMIKDSKDNND